MALFITLVTICYLQLQVMYFQVIVPSTRISWHKRHHITLNRQLRVRLPIHLSTVGLGAVAARSVVFDCFERSLNLSPSMPAAMPV